MALYWYTKAAKQGHATAQYNLGHMYKQVSRTVTTHSSQHLPLCGHPGPGLHGYGEPYQRIQSWIGRRTTRK